VVDKAVERNWHKSSPENTKEFLKMGLAKLEIKEN
jgi:hypothetical protein